MVDVVAVGEIFALPSAPQIFVMPFAPPMAAPAWSGAYGNDAGDNMKVKMARRMVQADGMKVETVIANDDVASAAKTEGENVEESPGKFSCGRLPVVEGAHGRVLGRGHKDSSKGDRLDPADRHWAFLSRHPRRGQTEFPH